MKYCPVCQTQWPLQTAQCTNCGHAFRTQFAAPAPQPSPGPYSHPLYAPQPKPKRWVRTVAIWMVVIFLLLGAATFAVDRYNAARDARIKELVKDPTKRGADIEALRADIKEKIETGQWK